MWHDPRGAKDLVCSDFYNTNFVSQGALDAIAAHGRAGVELQLPSGPPFFAFADADRVRAELTQVRTYP